MKIRQFQIDAFASKPFSGNPAAVCPLERWLDDALLQAIAEENNLSETAFMTPADKGYRLRWFTPLAEVDLCGHATLAAAWVAFAELGHAGETVRFDTRSGELTVHRDGDTLVMDFPAKPPQPCQAPEALLNGLGHLPEEVLAADDYVAVYAAETDIRGMVPDFPRLMNLGLRGVIVTAPGTETDIDFVCRFFAPKFGVAEDPVTGSAYCTLAPYWHGRLGKTRLRARQLSRRGGDVGCELAGARVLISGQAVKVMDAEIHLHDR